MDITQYKNVMHLYFQQFQQFLKNLRQDFLCKLCHVTAKLKGKTNCSKPKSFESCWQLLKLISHTNPIIDL